MKCERVNIRIDTGEIVSAMAPVIVSASRSTDIPAFYAKWFFNRLRRGYCVWTNPFNSRDVYVSFKNCRVIVFWTKNPEPIIPYLHELDEMGIHYYFNVTLNDYEDDGFEPNLPPLEHRIEVFRKLSRAIGADRVIWRFDPLLVSACISPRDLIRRIGNVGNRLCGFTRKLVFSFVDIKAYRNVQRNLVRSMCGFSPSNVASAEPTWEQCQELVSGLKSLRSDWRKCGWDLALATCGEVADFEGVEHNRCIDGELMERVFGDDKVLLHYLHTGELVEPDLFGEVPGGETVGFDAVRMKDRGQRKECGCMVSKDIGSYNTCRHFCAYCYANRGRCGVLRNAEKFNDESDRLA